MEFCAYNENIEFFLARKGDKTKWLATTPNKQLHKLQKLARLSQNKAGAMVLPRASAKTQSETLTAARGTTSPK